MEAAPASLLASQPDSIQQMGTVLVLPLLHHCTANSFPKPRRTGTEVRRPGLRQPERCHSGPSALLQMTSLLFFSLLFWKMRIFTLCNMQAFDDKKAQKTAAEQFYQMQFAIIPGADRIPNLTGSQLQRNQPSFQACHESQPTKNNHLCLSRV